MRKTSKKYLYRLITAILLSGCIMVQTGCSSAKDDRKIRVVLTTGFGKNEVFHLEKTVCTLPEIMVYVTNTRNQYVKIFGEQILDMSYDGETLEKNIKETVLAKVARIKAMNLLAQEREIVLEQDELDLIHKAAEEYYGSLNGTERKLMDVDLDTIESLYQEYTLANKVYEFLIADINPEISDDEARTITVQQILIKNYTLNENGEKVPFSDIARNEALEKAREALQRARDGEDFVSLIGEYSDDTKTTHSFGKGTEEKKYENAAFNLATNEISSIIENEDGYHIIKCISTFNKEETDRNKIKIVESRRKEVFDEQYSNFVAGLTKNLNTELWDSVSLINDEQVTTDSFMTVYNKYFLSKND